MQHGAVAPTPPATIPSPVADKTIRLHQDTLEYTSEGLKTTRDIDLHIGAVNRVVIERPLARRAVLVGVGGFPVDSAFPTPVVLAATIGPALQRLLVPEPPPLYQVYGHTSADGSRDHNKVLSERRAEILRAFLVADVAAAQQIARDESWDEWAQQVMLRTIRCDPGVIDGEHGQLTERAVRDFQWEYNDGVFHRRLELQPAAAPLAVDGVLGPATFDALVEAYVVATTPSLPASQLHPTHPTVGCADFNRVDEEDPRTNRRISLVAHPQLPPFHDRAPCQAGDHSVCPVDDAGPMRCLWYRSHVIDPPAAERPHAFFEPRWLPLPNGHVLLSVLTTLADDDEVQFQVFRSEPIGGPGDIDDSVLDEALSESMTGIVRMGVAQVVWAPPEDLDPFDVDDWMVGYDVAALLADPSLPFREPPKVRAPLFRVQGGGASAVSEPPAQELARVRFETEEGAKAEAQTAWGVDPYGNFVHVDLGGHRPDRDERPLEEPHRIVSLSPNGHRRRPPEEPV